MRGSSGSINVAEHDPSENNPRSFQRIKPGCSAIELEVMCYGKQNTDLRPLLILNSIEFAMPPSIEFCERMIEHGFRVVFIRRLGFGGTPPLPQTLLCETNIKNGAAVIAETSVVLNAISHLQLKNIILLGVGSANPVCYRLCQMHPEIKLSVFTNAVFNQNDWEGFRPIWFRSILRQVVLTKGGFKMAAKGLKFYIKRNPISFFDQLLTKSAADLKYRRDNEDDFISASQLMLNVEPETFFYDLSMSLWQDPFLKKDLFSNVPAVVLSGIETTTTWLARSRAEAKRLALPFETAPTGGMFTAYVAPDMLASVIRKYGG